MKHIVSLLVLWCIFFGIWKNASGSAGEKSNFENEEKQYGKFVKVRTKSGYLRGKSYQLMNQKFINVFLGIPYAKPPTGNLRFAKPVKVTPWNGTMNALNHGARCLQLKISIDPPLKKVTQSEDCLFMDIYTPSQGSEELLPVLFFIHGGSFFGGTGALYNFTNVAAKGVVVVTINYRLDVFGFLSTNNDVIPGNYGLWDQLLALDWVQENIRAFGGDPNSVTLMGMSAGAACVSLLALSSQAQGKFHKAIMHSGGSNNYWAVDRPLEDGYSESRHNARILGESLGCDLRVDEFSVDLLECLRDVDANRILFKSAKLKTLSKAPIMWRPTIDYFGGLKGGIVPSDPRTLLKNGVSNTVPTIRGYAKNDGAYLLQKTPLPLTLKKFQALMGFLLQFMPTGEEMSQNIVNSFVGYYYKGMKEDIVPNTLVVDALTDSSMVSDVIEEAVLYGRYSNSFVYSFDYKPSYSSYSEFGPTHTDDKGSMIGLPVGPDPYKYQFITDTDDYISDLMTTMWVNFATVGHPANDTIWPPFRADNTKWESLKHAKVFHFAPSPYSSSFRLGHRVEFWTRKLFNEELLQAGSSGASIPKQTKLLNCIIVYILCLFLPACSRARTFD